jgi:hypothetical protein
MKKQSVVKVTNAVAGLITSLSVFIAALTGLIIALHGMGFF